MFKHKKVNQKLRYNEKKESTLFLKVRVKKWSKLKDKDSTAS